MVWGTRLIFGYLDPQGSFNPILRPCFTLLESTVRLDMSYSQIKQGMDILRTGHRGPSIYHHQDCSGCLHTLDLLKRFEPSTQKQLPLEGC